MQNLRYDFPEKRSLAILAATKFYSGGAGSSSGKTTPQLTPSQLVDMYNLTLPYTLGNVGSQIAPTAMQMANAAGAANPMYTAGGLQQLTSMAPAYAQSGSLLARQQAANTADLLAGSGGNAAMEAARLNNQINTSQAAANQGVNQLMGAINLNGLSPGEQNAVERGINQNLQGTGNLGLNNALNTANNAVNWGGAFNQKIGLMNNAIGTATNTANAQNTQLNPFNAAMGAASAQNNFGLQQYNPTQANSTLNTPFSFASSFGNQLTGIGSASKGTTTSSNASGGCFLTTACCEHKGLSDDCELLQTLRKFRDEFVSKELVEEYYKIAPAIVEKIKKDEFKDSWLDYVYDIAKTCEYLIHTKQNETAVNLYKAMVSTLKKL